jgi:hypothetical protein
MGFLEEMMEMVEESERPLHPLSTEDISLRYPYALGIALLLARADNAFSTEGRAWFANFARSLGLPEEHVRRISAEAETADPVILHKILPCLAEPKISGCFLVDLRRAAAAEGKQSEAKIKMISGFQRLMKLPPEKESVTAAPGKAIVPSPLHCLSIQKCSNRIQYSIGSEFCHRECRERIAQ